MPLLQSRRARWLTTRTEYLLARVLPPNTLSVFSESTLVFRAQNHPESPQLTFERAEVPLTKRTWFDYTSFYMMFKKPWIDRLAIVKRGDKLTVIGQIERIDGVSVQLENCELVGSDSD